LISELFPPEEREIKEGRKFVDLPFSQQFQFPSSENRKRELEVERRGVRGIKAAWLKGKEIFF
jgi:hypothetical protein